MSDGYRGLAFSTLIAVLSLTFGLGAYWSSLQYPKERFQTYQDGNANADGAQAAVANLAAPVVERIPCNKPKSETESNLCAQWRAAKAAEKSAYWTALGFWATLAGIALLSWQIILTRQAVEETGKATVAMQNSNLIAEDTAKKQLRAYLAAKPMGINLLIGRRDVVGQIALENAGATPAFNVFLHVIMDIFDDKDRMNFEIPDDPGDVARALQPRLQMFQGSDNYPALDKINVADKYAYVWGVAYYSDAFGDRHTTRFCYRYATSSRDRTEAEKARLSKTAPKKSIVILASEKARLHQYGNDAD